MTIIIIIVIAILIFECLLTRFGGHGITKECNNGYELDYSTIHQDESKIIVNNHYQDNRKFIYNDNRTYHFVDNSKHYIDNSQHIDNRKAIDIESFTPDFSRHLTSNFDLSRYLSISNTENNLLSPKTNLELYKPTIPVFPSIPDIKSLLPRFEDEDE
jgi:hypothetical protein